MTSRIPIIKLAMTTTAASAVPLLFSKWNRVHCESKEDPHKYMVSRRIKEISKEYNIDAMDVVAGVCVTAGAAIIGILLLSMRTGNRSEGAMKLITHTERILLNNRGIRENIGPIFAGGSYKMGIQDNVARGTYSATIPGGVKCMVYLHATRPDNKSEDWNFDTLKLEVDSTALLDRMNKKFLDSVKFNYMTLEQAEESKEKIEMAILKDAESSGGGVEYLRLDDGEMFECLAYYLKGDYESFVKYFPSQGARPDPEMK